ncbi:MAG: serine hydrolase [Deltaproteobacteria bacterium]|nr:serine hydrolase [Deltaproteobacteria bacterium]
MALLEGDSNPRMVKALEQAFAEPCLERPVLTRAVVVVHRGRIVAERYATGFGATQRMPGWSMTKSIFNALIGVLVGEGKLVVDEPADVPEWSKPGDRRGTITLDHLLRMSSGLDWSEDYYDPIRSDVLAMLLGPGRQDMARFSADRDLAHEPGTFWSYSSGSSNVLSGIVRRATGDRYVSFPSEALFEPLGMNSVVLEKDGAGTFVASSYSYATARDFARLGLLFLRDGVWEGRRLLPTGWVDYSRTPAPASLDGGYGAALWLNAGRPGKPLPWPGVPVDAFAATGKDGQLVAIVPSLDLVVVRLGMSPEDGRWDRGRFLASIVQAFGP